MGVFVLSDEEPRELMVGKFRFMEICAVFIFEVNIHFYKNEALDLK